MTTTQELIELADAYATHRYVDGAQGNGPEHENQQSIFARESLNVAIEALSAEVERLKSEAEFAGIQKLNDQAAFVHMREQRDQHFAELEDFRSQVASLNVGFNNVQTDRDQIAAHRDYIIKVNAELRAQLEAQVDADFEAKYGGFPKVIGTSRVADNDRVLMISFSQTPTNIQLRNFDGFVKATNPT